MIAYYHAAAGFLTKETLTDGIWTENYDTCPGLNFKAVKKYLTESNDTQKGVWRAKTMASNLQIKKKQNQTQIHKKINMNICQSCRPGKKTFIQIREENFRTYQASLYGKS